MNGQILQGFKQVIKQYIPIWALIGLSTSFTAFAGTYNPPEEQKPCDLLCTQGIHGGFYVGVTGVYAKPSESGIGLATHSDQYTSSNGLTTSKSTPFEPSNSGGIGAKVGYDFGTSANSLEFDYFYFNNTTKDTADFKDNPSSFASMFFPNIMVSNPASFGITIHSKLEYTLNQYDLWLAHTFGSPVTGFSFKPAIGVRYASLSHDLTFDVPGAVKSDFDGIGPEIGFDAHYALGHGFGILGHFDDALMASRVNGSSYIEVEDFGIHSAFKAPDNNGVSNAVTGRVGADYQYVFNNGSSIALEAGYQAMMYADAFTIIQGNVASPVTPTVGQQITTTNSDDFSLRGPYLSLTYHV